MLAASPGAPILLRKRRLTTQDRSTLLDPYLPSPSNSTPSASRSNTPPPSSRLSKRPRFDRPHVRPFLSKSLHFLLFHLIHAFFAVYIRLRQAYAALRSQADALLFYHHRSPELMARDLAGLARVPGHVSVVLERRRGEEGIRRLMAEVGEVIAWAGAIRKVGKGAEGIGIVSFYEPSGVLKSYIPTLHQIITETLSSYYGSNAPSFSLHAPHTPTIPAPSSLLSSPQLQIHILSRSDSLQPLTDLTRTLTTLNQASKITVTPKLISTELDSVTGVPEPDLLILFGPRVVLKGYPCWQLRLTEIFCRRDHEGGVAYQVWLRALYRYGKVEMRFGR